MKRPLQPDELRLWSFVAATVHPLPGRVMPPRPEASPSASGPGRQSPASAPSSERPRARSHGLEAPEHIEPRRRHRIIRERDPIGARLDLHGLDQDRARAALESFLQRTWAEGYRAVLIITGKGVQGDGILRRRTPEWLAAPHLRSIVAGVSEAHRRHGGEGALYVALKRRPRS